jgi:WD40 repeat protein
MGKNNFDYSFSPDGKYIITSQTYGTISYWRIDKDEPVYQYYYSIAPSSFGYLAVSHNGQYIASHSRGYLVIYSTKWSPTSVVEKSGNQLIITNFYPNPAKTELIVEFTLPLPGNIQISLTNEAGITTLASLLFLEPGAHKTILNIGNIAPGPYFLKLEQNGLSDVKKIIILR